MTRPVTPVLARAPGRGRPPKLIAAAMSFPAGPRYTDGPHPERSNYESFAEFTDPDGNIWLLQEVDRGTG